MLPRLASNFQTQTILLPQLPEQPGLQVCTTKPAQFFYFILDFLPVLGLCFLGPRISHLLSFFDLVCDFLCSSVFMQLHVIFAVSNATGAFFCKSMLECHLGPLVIYLASQNGELWVWLFLLLFRSLRFLMAKPSENQVSLSW